MNLRDLNWSGILFGSAAGLFVNLVLFVILFGIGENVIAQVIIQMFGFFVAGWVAGRFSLIEPRLSGGFAALILFFFVVTLSITGDGINLLGLLIFGIGAALLGPAGAAVAYNRSIKT